MSMASDPGRSVRLAHRGALAVLAGCAALIAIFPTDDATGTPAAVFPYVAIGLGVSAIACRQQAVANSRRGKTTFALSIAAYVFAAAIGIVGLALVWLEGLRQTALLYTVGGAILAMRPPQSMAAGAPRDPNTGGRGPAT